MGKLTGTEYMKMLKGEVIITGAGASFQPLYDAKKEIELLKAQIKNLESEIITLKAMT